MTVALRKIRVVAVDDDANVLACVEQFLGLEPRVELVGTGRNGRQALQLANSLRPDVMLLDVRMPCLNGLEAAARIARAFPSIALVMLTSEESADIIKEALRAGARDYLSKSEDMSRVAERVIAAEGRRDPLAPSRGLATVWSFYAPKATAGCTTLAVGTAFDLASVGFRVVLVDLDHEAGDVRLLLKQPVRQRAEYLLGALGGDSEMTTDFVKGFVRTCRFPSKPPTEFDIIESPGEFGPLSQGAGPRVSALFDLLATMYDYVVVDLPAGGLFTPHVAPLLDVVEKLIMVTHREPSSSARLGSLLRTLAFGGFPVEKIVVLASEIAGMHGFDARTPLSRLDPPVGDLIEVPFDVATCSVAVGRGVPVVFADANAPLSQFIRRFVDHALNRVSTIGERTDLWKKLKRLLRM